VITLTPRNGTPADGHAQPPQHRRPRRRDRTGRSHGTGLLVMASALLLILAAAQGYVSFRAQYAFVDHAKHAHLPAVLEALGLDTGAVIFALLALALACRGARAATERVLNVACALGSLTMNLLAADLGSPRSVTVWVLPSALYALTSDRLIAVIRRWALTAQPGARPAEPSAWRSLGVLTLWALRLLLDTGGTVRGFRRWVLTATPIGPTAPPPADLQPPANAIQPRRERPALEASERARPKPSPDDAPAPGETKRAVLVRLYERLGDRRPAIRRPHQDRRGRHRDRGPDRLPPRHRPPRTRPLPGHQRERRLPRSRSRHPGGLLMLHLHVADLLIILIAYVAALAVIRVAIGNPNAARHRSRTLRWRIRLYLRPGPSYANLLELAVRWSRLRAVRTGRRARPSLPWWARLFLPVTDYAVRLGRAHFGRRVIASMEDQTLVLAAPRTGKSGWLADRIIDHPGPVVTTTTRTDLLDNTAPLRARHGMIHVFNPETIGGLPSTFRWNPLQYCDYPPTALLRAASFTAATEAKGMHDMVFWIGKATSVLASFLHAAALDGRTMLDVYQWAHGIDSETPERILTTHPGAAGGWFAPIREISKPGRTADSIRMTVTRALAWLADPAVAAATTPGPGDGFDIDTFITGRHTLYLIGTGREEAPIAPLFRAFTEYLHDRAAYLGSWQPHGRLDPPLLMALDEVTQICPVPLPLWMADSAGKGILIVAVCHGLAQLEGRWDRTGAQAIWDTAGLKVILGGVTDPGTLDTVSQLCGEINLRTHSHTRDHKGKRTRTTSYEPARILPPELLRTLPEWRALVIRTNLSPVVIRLRMAWRRHDYRRAYRSRPPQLALPAPTPDSSGLRPLEPTVKTNEIVPTLEQHSPQSLWPAQPIAQPDTSHTPSLPSWATAQEDTTPWPFPGQDHSVRPRRPWEPPASPQDSQ